MYRLSPEQSGSGPNEELWKPLAHVLEPTQHN